MTSKKIPGKECLNGVDKIFFERWKLAYEKTLRMKLLRKEIKSHSCLEIFQSTNATN